MALAFLFADKGSATEPDTSGIEVALDVQHMTPPPGKDVHQYMCAAKISLNGELILAPKIQTQQGLEASVSSTTDSGTRVTLRILVSAPDRLTYDVLIAPSQGRAEHHRATVGFKS
jgi:hypothetical protein